MRLVLVRRQTRSSIMASKPKSDDQESKKRAAESLSHQIDDIVSGRTEAGIPKSFRDFVERKMAEDRRKAPGSSAEPATEEKPKDNVPGNIPRRCV
jgi:hypothetical protein